jgi:putative salt-induced outer membrane protein YdiY
MRTFSNRLRCLFVAAALLSAPHAYAEKTDIVELVNGDQITCEVKGLERGRLEISTDSFGTAFVEWKDILRVTSRQFFVVELQDGSRHEGILARPDTERELVLFDKGQEQVFSMGDVVLIDVLVLADERLERWDGSISAGFDATKANNDVSLSASFDARRRGEDFVLSFAGSVYSRSQENIEDSLRANLNGIYRGLLEDRWFWAGLGGIERNDELGIDLRTQAGGGYGRFFVQNNRTLWSGLIGLTVVNEQRAGDESAENNVEGLINTEYEYFTYDTPKTTFKFGLSLYPGITESGRIRAETNLGLRRELIEDLFLDLSFYGSFDNEPPEEGEKSDYGIVTSLGYSF